jgi:calcineurin-like phosphoesterase
MEPAQGEGTLSGIAVETDDRTGLAIRVAAVRLGPHLTETWPGFWD